MPDVLEKLVPWRGASHVPVTAKQIAQLESAFGPLPARYKSFLSTYGASAFAGLAMLHANGTEYPLMGFFGAGPWTESVISRNFARRDEATPAGLMAIGSDPIGGLFLLRPSDGTVLHWDTEIDASEAPEAVRIVAPSFDALLDHIVVEE